MTRKGAEYTVRKHLLLTPGQEKLIAEAAERAGFSFTAWCRMICVAKARELAELRGDHE